MLQGTDKTHQARQRDFYGRLLVRCIIALCGIVLLYYFLPKNIQQASLIPIISTVLIVSLGIFLLTFQSMREKYIWVIVSAATITWVWVISLWFQAYFSFDAPQKRQSFPQDEQTTSTFAFRADLPSSISFQPDEFSVIRLWWSCRTSQCADIEVYLSSQDNLAQFALPGPDQPIWQKKLMVLVPGNGDVVDILIDPISFANQQDVFLIIDIPTIGVQGETIGKVVFQGQEKATILNFSLEFAKGISVIIAVLTAAFATLNRLEEQKRLDEQKLDEQKRNEQKHKITALITRLETYIYQRGQVAGFLRDVVDALSGWEDWTSEQKGDFKKHFESLIRRVVETSESLEHYAIEPSRWNELARLIVEKTGASPSLLEEITQSAPGYQPETVASLYPPELYPLQKRFARQAVPLPTSGTWGLSDWKMRFAPFDNSFNVQFKYIEGNDFPLLARINFPFNTNRFTHQAYAFQNTWDLRAGYYQHCRTFDTEEFRKQSRETFFVPVLPDVVPAWETDISGETILLHGLAAAWVRTLANNPKIADQLILWEVEALARLIVWHYGSAQAIKVLSLPEQMLIIQHIQSIKPEIALPKGDAVRWMALRPPQTEQTLYLLSQSSLFGKPKFIHFKGFPFSKLLLSTMENEFNFVAQFTLIANTNKNVMRMSDEELSDLLDERLASSIDNLAFFSDFFDAHPKLKLNDLLSKFILRANGSPGHLLHMAHALLQNHLAQHPTVDYYINPDLLRDFNEPA